LILAQLLIDSAAPVSLSSGRLFVWSPPENAFVPDAPLPTELSVREAAALLASQSPPALVDCREEDEFAIANIPGARLLPMSQIVQRVGELDASRDERVIVHCHHGGRSLRVARWLREQGFSQAQSMAGGIDGWALEVDPSTPRY